MYKFIFLTTYILLFILILIPSGYQNHSGEPIDLKTKRDTLTIQIQGDLIDAIWHDGKYYLTFEQYLLWYHGSEKKLWIIEADPRTKKYRIFTFPGFRDSGLNFFKWKNEILLKNGKRFYRFYPNKDKWEPVKFPKGLVYEDSLYRVYSLYLGEWGGKTWFQNRQTGKEYIIDGGVWEIDPWNPGYIVSGAYKVFWIRNPEKLAVSPPEFGHDKIEHNGNYSAPLKLNNNGLTTLYADSTCHSWGWLDSSHTYIAATFIRGGKLYHVFSTDTGDYITRIRSRRMEAVKKLPSSSDGYISLSKIRNSPVPEEEDLLQFSSKTGGLNGIVRLHNDSIHVFYIKNTAIRTPPLKGRSFSHHIFTERLAYWWENMPRLFLHTITEKEKKWQSIDVTPNRLIGIRDEFKPGHAPLDTIKAYRIRVDSLINNITEYHADKSSGRIYVVTTSWIGKLQRDAAQKKVLNTYFDEYIHHLVRTTDSVTGLPHSKMVNKKYNEFKYSWKKSNGQSILLEYEPNRRVISFHVYWNNHYD